MAWKRCHAGYLQDIILNQTDVYCPRTKEQACARRMYKQAAFFSNPDISCKLDVTASNQRRKRHGSHTALLQNHMLHVNVLQVFFLQGPMRSFLSLHGLSRWLGCFSRNDLGELPQLLAKGLGDLELLRRWQSW